MMLMGDWTRGVLQSGRRLSLDRGRHPGLFVVLSDSFGPCQNAHTATTPSPSLRSVAPGPGRLQPIEVSIPARTDADRTKYDGTSGAMDISPPTGRAKHPARRRRQAELLAGL